MPVRRRRWVEHMTAEHCADHEFECDRCGLTISAGSIYIRKVFTVRGRTSRVNGRRYPDRLEVERYHSLPDCHCSWMAYN